MSGEIEARLMALNLILPEATSPVANYVPTVRSGDFLYVSGQLAVVPGGAMTTGIVGLDVTIEGRPGGGANLRPQYPGAGACCAGLTRSRRASGQADGLRRIDT